MRPTLWLLAALLTTASLSAVVVADDGGSGSDSGSTSGSDGGSGSSSTSGSDGGGSGSTTSTTEGSGPGPSATLTQSDSTAAPPADSGESNDTASGNASHHDGNETSDGHGGQGAEGSGAGEANRTGHGPDGGQTAGEDGRHEDTQSNGFVGAFAANGTQVQGAHVAFQLDNGTVAAYTVDGKEVFASIAFDPALGQRARVDGAEMRVSGDGSEFRAVDTPNGNFRAESDGSITLTLAANWTAAPAPAHGEGRILLAGPAGAAASLTGDGLAVAANGTVVEARQAGFLLLVGQSRAELSDEVAQAVDDGHVGGEVVLQAGAHGAHATVIEPGAVNLTVADTAGRLFITAEGHGNGTTLLFTLQPGVLGDPFGLTVRFDGQDIQRARDMQALLATKASDPATFLVVVGANATQVLVAVPHFSLHTIELATGASSAAVVSGMHLAAFLAAGAVAAAFVAVTVRLRSRQR